jgi:putative ABC transport system ATP-binding protein
LISGKVPIPIKVPMDNEVAVQCEGVIKDFGSGSTRQRVLHGIDWRVPIGATTFLVGPSGCGKTTLISIIAGLLSATAGRVRILDNEITKMRKGAVVRFRADHLGFIFQQSVGFVFSGSLSVRFLFHGKMS